MFTYFTNGRWSKLLILTTLSLVFISFNSIAQHTVSLSAANTAPNNCNARVLTATVSGGGWEHGDGIIRRKIVKN